MVHGPATYARNQGQRVPDVMLECRIAVRIRLIYADLREPTSGLEPLSSLYECPVSGCMGVQRIANALLSI